MNRLRIKSILAVFLLIGPIGSASAFWSWVKIWSGIADDHQVMTSAALASTDMFKFQGQDYSFSERAIDAINLAHTAADDSDNYLAIEHFDSETISRSIRWLRRRLDLLETYLYLKSPSSLMWDSLGFQLHAIQDFYSHSTWVERGNSGIVDFGALLRSSDIFSDARLQIGSGASCFAEGFALLSPLNPPFTTGYYDPIDKPPGKCWHGDTFSSLVPRHIQCLPPVIGARLPVEGISKDTPCAFYYPFNARITALKLAEGETRAYVNGIIKYLEETENAEGFCLLLGLAETEPVCQVLPPPPEDVPGSTFHYSAPPFDETACGPPDCAVPRAGPVSMSVTFAYPVPLDFSGLYVGENIIESLTISSSGVGSWTETNSTQDPYFPIGASFRFADGIIVSWDVEVSWELGSLHCHIHTSGNFEAVPVRDAQQAGCQEPVAEDEWSPTVWGLSQSHGRRSVWTR